MTQLRPEPLAQRMGQPQTVAFRQIGGKLQHVAQFLMDEGKAADL